jgi:DNA-binding HxlR family transcriptional regulator
LLVLRDVILHGKTRFAEFQSSDEKIASNTLSDRLRRLGEQGFIAIEKDPSDARQKIYSVTKKGLSLTPVLLEIAAWGASHDG